MNEYKLTVVIPIYNTQQYLKQCVDSVLNQKLANIEIVLVDDGSPDYAGVLCDELQEKYCNIKVIHKVNEGLGIARNYGMSIASGHYITFLDSDDYVDCNYYLKMYQACVENNLDICISGGVENFNNDTISIHYFNNLSKQITSDNNESRQIASKAISKNGKNDDAICGSVCMMLFKGEFIRKNDLKFISERTFISEDIWFVIDALEKAQKVYFSDIVGYKYRYNPESLSHGYNKNRFSQLNNAVKMLISKCEYLKLNDYYGRVMMYFWINFEKCINQEVRFNRETGLKNIAEMCTCDTTLLSFEYLERNRCLSSMHQLLFFLLKNRLYIAAYIMLFIYNIIKH